MFLILVMMLYLKHAYCSSNEICQENSTGSVPESVHERMSFEENSNIEIESGESDDSR